MRSLITDLLQIAKHRPHPHATACTTTPATHAPYRAHRRQEARCPGGSAAHTAPPKLRARACCAGSPDAARGVPHRHSCDQQCAAPCKRALQLSQPPAANAAHAAQVSSSWLKSAPFFRAPPCKGFACKRRRRHPSPLSARSARKFSPEALFKQNSCDLRAACGGQKSHLGSVGGWCNTGCEEAGRAPQLQQHQAAARDQQSPPRAQRAHGVGTTRYRRLSERHISLGSWTMTPLPLG